MFFDTLVTAPLECILHRCTPPPSAVWDSQWAPYLKSALSGGQWPQERKAKIKAAAGLSDLCQLCESERGTLQHRLVCPQVVPTEGWAPLPSKALHANCKLGSQRLLVLSTRALLAIRLPVPQCHEGWFNWWLTPDPRAELESCFWFTDGSLMGPMVAPLQSCGFAVVVTTAHGTLLGFGYGAPPS